MEAKYSEIILYLQFHYPATIAPALNKKSLSLVLLKSM